MERILELIGITNVEFANNATAFVEIIERFDPDVILLDLHLSDADGVGAPG